MAAQTDHMGIRPPKLNLFLGLCLVFIRLLLNVGNTMGDGRKLTTNIDRNAGFISIDCGATNDYLDEETGISYQTDTDFVETGTNSVVLPAVNLDYPYFGGLLNTLRIFPEGKRNCYALKPKQGKHHTYLIRAYFAYGNYDGKNQTPVFDLYLGVSHWDTVSLSKYYYVTEIIHTPTIDTIHVCLVKTVVGVPFISALELRPLTNSIYQTPSPSQSLLISQGRFDVASTSSATHSRYKDDIYDRLWRKIDVQNWYQINGSVDIDPASVNNSYKLPAQVLRSAAQSFNLSYPLNFDYDSSWKNLAKPFKYYVYFHFCEIQKLSLGRKRIINITVEDENILSQPIILEYLKPQTITPQNATQGYVHFNISATSESDAPPILNAFEVYKLISPLPSPTDKRDVDAIMDIKNTYKIFNLDWQGDPCVPTLAWDGLNCSSGINGYNTRITSVNLTATKLRGQIATSFSQLTELEYLDLSSNDLSGSVPEFLAKLPKLKVLKLSGNKFAGTIPKALKEKSDVTLQLSLANNPGLCLEDSCKRKNFVIPLVASVSALVVIMLVSLGIWIFKTNKFKVQKILNQKKLLHEIGDIAIPFTKNSTEKFNKSDKAGHEIHIFSFKSIVIATDNFSPTNKLGEGGYGPVYKGKLLDGQEIAIKRLSKCSKQGLTEFKNEVKLIAKLQHTNLVRLFGFCIEGEEKMLIYEYMPNKSLDSYLFDHNNKVLLDWRNRLNIIQGIAQGLIYLHKYSRLKVIHRDLKPSNILFDHEMCPKISDFGMARVFGLKEFEQENTNKVVGTYGYMSPEYALNGIVSIKTDIFSFGVLLLEIVSGKRNNSHFNFEDPLNLIGYAWKLWNEGKALQLVDPLLNGMWNADEILRYIQIGLLCVQDQAKDRPDMLNVVSFFSNENILLVEPKQPAFFINTIENTEPLPDSIVENYSIYNVTISDINCR